MASGDEKFRLEGVKFKMGVIEQYFADFASTLDDINAFVETNVNASLESAAYGDLGGKLINIWDYNASTFQDFHENFDNWAQVVAVIAANNSEFTVEAQAAYRDNAGTLDGVQEARKYVGQNNGISNAGTGYAQLSNDAKAIIDSSIAQGSTIPEQYNIFGGKTVVASDGSIEYYDKDGKLMAKRIGDTYYDGEGNEIGDYEAYKKWLTDNGYRKSMDKVQNEKNNFGGKTIEKEDGTLEFYDDKGNRIAYKKDGKYYKDDGTEIGDEEAYKKWLTDNNYSTEDTVISDTNDFGGKTVEKPNGEIQYLDKDGKVAVTYKDGKYYDANGKLIGGEKEYQEWLKNNKTEGAPEGGGDGRHDSKDPTTQTGKDERGEYTYTVKDGVETRVYKDGRKAEITYGADGKTPVSEIVYDKSGKKTSETTYNADGSKKTFKMYTNGELAKEHRYSYENGKLTKDELYNKDGKLSSTTTYKDGKKESTVSYYSDGKTEKKVLKYDSNENVIEEVNKDASGNVESTVKFSYDGEYLKTKETFDSRDRKIESVSYEDGVVSNTTKYSYNSEGKLDTEIVRNAKGKAVKVINYEADGKTIAKTHEYTYDSQNRIAKEEIRDGSGNLTRVYDCKEGKVVTTTDYEYQSGTLSSKEVRDANDNPIEVTHYESDGKTIKETYSYTYDSGGKLANTVVADGSGRTTEKILYRNGEYFGKEEYKYTSSTSNVLDSKTYKNSDGKTIRIERYDSDGKTITKTHVYSYDSSGQIAREDIRDGSGKLTSAIICEKGVPVRREEYSYGDYNGIPRTDITLRDCSNNAIIGVTSEYKISDTIKVCCARGSSGNVLAYFKVNQTTGKSETITAEEYESLLRRRGE